MIAQLSLTVISKSILSGFKMGHVLCLQRVCLLIMIN